MQTIYHEDQLTVSANVRLTVNVQKQKLAQDLSEYEFDLEWDADDARMPESRVTISWMLPCLDVQFMWQPDCRVRRALDSDWRLKFQSMLTGSAPLGVTFNGAGDSVYAYAASEIKKISSLRMGVNENQNAIHTEFSMGLAQFNGQKPSTRLKIRSDHRRVPFHQAITDACEWWNKTLNIQPMRAPESCFAPLYSSWYNFHQGVSAAALESECALAKELGMETVILDDGWHSDHDGPGYGYTGDWEVCESKFPDIKAHIRAVHELGMKYMMWFSVPFMGYNAKNQERFKNKLLRKIERNSCGVLDPRYPDVREYIIGIYEHAVREYRLDGLKLDFIDQFVDTDNLPLQPEMDYSCVQESVERLMTDVMRRVSAINPNIMIEFRQRYIGPGIRRFGNMFCVGDCASDIVSNRVGVTDIRLMGADQAAHSDMLSWNHSETPEHAALQILNVIFGVVQFSQIIAKMPESHRKMTKFWLDFAKRYSKTLLRSEFIPMEPQYMYPVITARDERTSITAVYMMNKVLKLDASRTEAMFINASHAPVLYIETDAELSAQALTRNATGDVTYSGNMRFTPGVNVCEVPLSGLLKLTFNVV